MPADPHPMFDVRLPDGRITRVIAGKSFGSVLVSLAVIAVIGLLAAMGGLTVDDLVKLLPALPKG